MVFLAILFLCLPPVAALEPQWTYKTKDHITAIAVSLRGSTVVAGCDDGWVYALNDTGELLWKRQMAGSVKYIAITNDGEFTDIILKEKQSLYRVNRSGVDIWAAKTAAYENSIPGEPTAFDSIPDGSSIIFGNEYGMLWRFNASGARVWERRMNARVFDAAQSSDGNTTAASNLGSVYLLNSSGIVMWGTGGWANRIALSRDGKILAAGGGEGSLGEIALYNNTTLVLYNKTGTINDIAMSYLGMITATASQDGNVSVFSRNGTILWNYDTGSPVFHVAVPSDGSVVSSWSEQKRLLIFNAKGTVIGNATVEGNVCDIALSADGTALVTGSDDLSINFFVVPATPTPATAKPSPQVTEYSPTDEVPHQYTPSAGESLQQPTTRTAATGAPAVMFLLVMCILIMSRGKRK